MAAKPEIRHCELWIARIIAPIAGHIRNAHDRRGTHAMIYKYAISGFHVANRTKSLWIPDAIPHGMVLPCQLFEWICFRVCFCEEISGLGWYFLRH